jgi:hypothetical protein
MLASRRYEVWCSSDECEYSEVQEGTWAVRFGTRNSEVSLFQWLSRCSAWIATAQVVPPLRSSPDNRRRRIARVSSGGDGGSTCEMVDSVRQEKWRRVVRLDSRGDHFTSLIDARVGESVAFVKSQSSRLRVRGQFLESTTRSSLGGDVWR